MKSYFPAAWLLLAWCGSAMAQPFEFSVIGSKYRFGKGNLGSYSPEGAKDNDTKIKGRNGFGARFTLNTPGYYGHEFTYLYNRADLTAVTRATVDRSTVTTTHSSKIIVRQASYNFLIYMMPRGERWRPYITGGLQAAQYGRPNIPNISTFSTRNYGANYGAGIKIKIAPHVLIRGDVRDYIGGKPYDLTFADATRSGGSVHTYEFSFGAGFTF
jgi:hypothetical protein